MSANNEVDFEKKKVICVKSIFKAKLNARNTFQAINS